MKKSGSIFLENMIAISLILIIIGGISINVSNLKNIYSKYESNKFKLEFLDFINLGKYMAVNDNKVYTLRFEEKSISLVNKEHITVKKFTFPQSIKMVRFNGIHNRTLDIQKDGTIPRGATFTYKFYNEIKDITIYAVTGKVNYG